MINGVKMSVYSVIFSTYDGKSMTLRFFLRKDEKTESQKPTGAGGRKRRTTISARGRQSFAPTSSPSLKNLCRKETAMIKRIGPLLVFVGLVFHTLAFAHGGGTHLMGT